MVNSEQASKQAKASEQQRDLCTGGSSDSENPWCPHFWCWSGYFPGAARVPVGRLISSAMPDSPVRSLQELELELQNCSSPFSAFALPHSSLPSGKKEPGMLLELPTHFKHGVCRRLPRTPRAHRDWWWR